MNRVFFSLVLLTNFLQCFAQEYVVIDPRLTKKQDIFLNQQAEVSLNLATKVLTDVPPQIPEPVERTLALYLLDGVFHDVYAPQRLPVQTFVQKRIDQAAKDIKNTTVTEGAVIWKLYDHGFVVRTKTVTIGFDLIRPATRFDEFVTDSKTEMGSIISECDVLFVSHWHNDHADEWVARTFIEQGKPVVSPPDVWKEKPFYREVTHFERNKDKFHTLSIQNGKQKLKVVIYPGHQDKILNNIPVIYTPDNLCFSHNGDQNSGNMAQDTTWLFNIKDHHNIDVLMYNSYMSSKWISGFDPELVITGHENEFGHGIGHRIPYWEIHHRLKSVPYPYVVMAWGEKYHYIKEPGHE